MIEAPAVGTPVQFYPKDDTNNPQMAFVTARNEQGMVKLNHFSANGGPAIPSHTYLHHTDSEWVKEHPQAFQHGNVMPGTWGFVPGLGCQCKPEANIETGESIIAKVKQLQAEGFDAEKIHPKVRGQGVTMEQVREMMALTA